MERGSSTEAVGVVVVAEIEAGVAAIINTKPVPSRHLRLRFLCAVTPTPRFRSQKPSTPLSQQLLPCKDLLRRLLT